MNLIDVGYGVYVDSNDVAGINDEYSSTTIFMTVYGKYTVYIYTKAGQKIEVMTADSHDEANRIKGYILDKLKGIR